MQRQTITPRADWKAKVEKVGLVFHSLDDGSGTYWDESAYYEFTSAEVDRLEAASNRLQEMCLAAGQFIIDHNRWADLKIPVEAIPQIKKTWNDEPPALYGRFDLAYDGRQIKLLEYNADTPTALLEAAVVQWYWLQDLASATGAAPEASAAYPPAPAVGAASAAYPTQAFPKADQWNSIHEKLIAKWKDLKDYVTEPVTFGFTPTVEDEFTTGYLRDTAEQAGIKTQALRMSDIGFDHKTFTFVDLESHPIKTIFKLYPWEWLLKEQFGPRALDFMDKMQWIEPIWKMMFSNKGLLAILWEMYPNDELLLPAYLDGPRQMQEYVRKPLLGREGANVQLVRSGQREQTYGPYGGEGFVYQALAPIPCFDGNYPVLGSWMIADQGAAGMGIRESDTPVTTNRSRFVPHLFR